jgi:hypothetical protein
MKNHKIEPITPNSTIKKSEIKDQSWEEIEKENEFYMGIIYQLAMAA